VAGELLVAQHFVEATANALVQAAGVIAGGFELGAGAV
jgi:hypothetical protein